MEAVEQVIPAEKPAKKKIVRRKKRRVAAAPKVKPEPKQTAPAATFAGLTMDDCPNGCSIDGCVISGKPVCGHPAKAPQGCGDPEAAKRLSAAQQQLGIKVQI